MSSSSALDVVGPHVVRLTMSWHYATIAVSYLVAVLAAYSTVNVLQHPLSHVVSILAAFGFAVGGVWSMHFIGMEAMLLGIDVEFEPGLTVGSAAAAFVCVAVALVLCKWQVSRGADPSSGGPSADSEEEEEEATVAQLQHETTVVGSDASSSQVSSSQRRRGDRFTSLHSPRSAHTPRTRREKLRSITIRFLNEHWAAFKAAPHLTLNVAAWLVAGGVCTMHYLGMEAMTTIATVEYDVPVVVGSVLIAIFAATAALYMALVLPFTKRYVVPTALVMGVAVCGMHYAGMYGVRYEVDLNSPAYLAVRRAKSVERPWGFWVLALSTAYSFCLLALNSYLYQRSLGFTLRKSRAALRTSKAVAALLTAYDTDAVASALDHYERSATADAALALVYRTLLENLNTYRPFLPQYLFHADDDALSGASQQTSEASPRAQRSQGASEGYLVTSVTSESTLKDPRGRARSVTSGGNTSPPATPLVQAGAARFPAALQHYGGTVSYCRLLLAPLTACLNEDTTLPPPRTQKRSVELPGQSESEGGLSVSFARTERDPTGRWAERLVSAQQAAVLAVNRIGRMTSASVHCVTGDAVVCSWNATRRVHQPAAKMATFVLRLQAALADPIPSVAARPSQANFAPTLGLCGVGFTGGAECLLAGDRTGRMPVVSGYWAAPAAPGARPIEALMLDEARLLGGVVVDSATATGAETVAESRLVDAVGAHGPRHPHLPHTPPPQPSPASAAEVNASLLSSNSAVEFSPGHTPGHSPGHTPGHTTVPLLLPTDAAPSAVYPVHVLLAGFDQEAEDEWMYVLQQQDKRRKSASLCPLRGAVTAALQGDFAAVAEGVAALRVRIAERAAATDAPPIAEAVVAVLVRAADVVAAKLRVCKAEALGPSEFACVPVVEAAVARTVATLE